MLAFNDVKKCGSVAEFNLFVRLYLAERGLVADGEPEATRKTYWALFYYWRDSIFENVVPYSTYGNVLANLKETFL